MPEHVKRYNRKSGYFFEGIIILEFSSFIELSDLQFEHKLMNNIETALANEGFVIVDHFFGAGEMKSLEKNLHEIEAFDFSKGTVTNLLKKSDAVSVIANDERLIGLFTKIAKRKMFPVKAFVLDKTLKNNWRIPWHQDLKIAVKTKVDDRRYMNWSVEAGVLHVEPPTEMMEQLITLRIHLDSCTAANGAISVIPGSHKKGVLKKNTIEEIIKQSRRQLCNINKYGLMIMRPLILHDSPPSSSPKHRRILQIEYGIELTDLEWDDLD